MVITPPGRWGLPPLREVWAAREVLFRFGQRDVVLRYRQTAIGVLWVLLQPLAAAGIFSIIFGSIAKLPTGGVPPFLFSYVGMLAWNLFNSIIGRGAGSLVGNQSLISKVYFPRMIIPLSSVQAVLLDFAVALVLGLVLLAVFGIYPGWAVLLLPVWVVLICLFALGLTLAAAAIMVRYRDVAYVIPWVMQVLMYASPIAYSLDAVPANLRPFFDLNPLTWYLEGFRFSLLGLAAPSWAHVLGAVAIALSSFVLGSLVFQRFEREFADVI